MTDAFGQVTGTGSHAIGGRDAQHGDMNNPCAQCAALAALTSETANVAQRTQAVLEAFPDDAGRALRLTIETLCPDQVEYAGMLMELLRLRQSRAQRG